MILMQQHNLKNPTYTPSTYECITSIGKRVMSEIGRVVYKFKNRSATKTKNAGRFDQVNTLFSETFDPDLLADDSKDLSDIKSLKTIKQTTARV